MKPSTSLLLLITLCLATCRTMPTLIASRQSQIEHDSISKVQHRTVEHSNLLTLERDTTYILDSVRLELRHDTVYHTRWRTEFRDRLVYHTDTLLCHDTIRIDTYSQTVSSDSIIFTEKKLLSSRGNGTGATLTWCWKMLIWNTVVVVLMVVFYILRKQLLR